jgi:hypothetical protein
MKVVKSLADIALPEEGTIEIPRKSGALQIPIKPISLAEQQRMGRDHKAPAPPQKFDKSGKMTADGKPGFYFDENDPVHLELVANVSQELLQDMTISGLAFDVDGATLEEKWDALSKVLTTGDLTIILDAVNALSNIEGTLAEVKNS